MTAVRIAADAMELSLNESVIQSFCTELAVARDQIGVIVVDHGSRRSASNELLLEIVDMYRQQSELKFVEPAHMELAEPSIETAFAHLVQGGAAAVIVFPYFLLPGRHWTEDIPTLVRKAAIRFSNIPFLVTAPLGLHPLLAEIINQRIDHCMAHSLGQREACDICHGTEQCGLERNSSNTSKR